MENGLTGIILAGGRSTRFGSDKASALLDGRPLLDHVAAALAPVCDEVIVVHARGQDLPAVGVPVRSVEDQFDTLGPLAGMVAGFAAAVNPYAFVVSTDAPLLQPGLVEYLATHLDTAGADIVYPEVGGFPQPLVAAYRVAACLPRFRDAVVRGDLKITAAFGGLHVDTIDEAQVQRHDPGLLSFMNANTPEALETIREAARGAP